MAVPAAAHLEIPARSLIENGPFELNKIMGAVLGTCLVLLVTNFAAHADFRAREAGEAGF